MQFISAQPALFNLSRIDLCTSSPFYEKQVHVLNKIAKHYDSDKSVMELIFFKCRALISVNNIDRFRSKFVGLSGSRSPISVQTFPSQDQQILIVDELDWGGPAAF